MWHFVIAIVLWKWRPINRKFVSESKFRCLWQTADGGDSSIVSGFIHTWHYMPKDPISMAATGVCKFCILGSKIAKVYRNESYEMGCRTTWQASGGNLGTTDLAKARFPLPELTGDRFPFPVNTGRVDGRRFPLAELTRLVETGLKAVHWAYAMQESSHACTLIRLSKCVVLHNYGFSRNIPSFHAKLAGLSRTQQVP